MIDIEVLEEMLKDYKNKIEHEYGFSDYFIQKTKKEKQAIENLINRIKELEEIEEEHRKENGKLIEENNELKEEIEDWKFTKKYVEDNYIHKDKMKQRIKELEKEKEGNPDFATIQAIIIDYENLLEN